MIPVESLRGLALGISVLLAQQILYLFVLSRIPFAEELRYVLMAAPDIAAFLAAHWAVNHKMFVGTLVAPLGVAIAMMAARIYGALGFSVDSLGGLFDEILVPIVFYGVSSGCGAVLALVVNSARRTRARKMSGR